MDNKSLYDEVVALQNDKGQKEFSEWCLPNTGKKTDYAQWKKSIEDLDEGFINMLVEEVEKPENNE